MPRSVQHREDGRRTALLDIEELFVEAGKGGENYYFTWLFNPMPACCPECKCEYLKTQGYFSRSYFDVLPDGLSSHVIQMTYQFYKYRCKNPDCRRISAAPISFASINDNITHRLEDKIVEMVIAGNSYGSISISLQDAISRQAVGQIFQRWARRKDEARVFRAQPHCIAVLSGKAGRDGYTLILSCEKEIRILDILYGVETVSIISAIRRIDCSSLWYVLTDCDPIIFGAVKEALPKTTHIIPAEFWFSLVESDFDDYAKIVVKWLQIPGAYEAITNHTGPVDQLKIDRILDKRKELRIPYKNLEDLRDLVFNREFRWDISELDGWSEDIDKAFRLRAASTMLQYKEYRNEIMMQQEHPEAVPDNLYSLCRTLEHCFSNREIFSTEVLQAMVLYSTDADLNNWQGIRIEEAITKLNTLPTRSRRNEYDDE